MHPSARHRAAGMKRRACVAAATGLAIASCLPGRARASDTAADDAISVTVDRRGELVVIDVEVKVDASVAEVWGVMTDYDRMANFISTMKSSKVTSRRGNSLEVAQSGETKVMFMRFAFAGVRGIELVPMKEIRSRLIEGDFKSFQSTTRLLDKGEKMMIVHHGEYVPKSWLPPVIGPAIIESGTRRHYREVLAEVQRRKGQTQR